MKEIDLLIYIYVYKQLLQYAFIYYNIYSVLKVGYNTFLNTPKTKKYVLFGLAKNQISKNYFILFNMLSIYFKTIKTITNKFLL